MTTTEAGVLLAHIRHLYDEGNLFLALDSTSEALQAHPKHEELNVLYCQLLSRAGAYAQAAAVSKALLQQVPDPQVLASRQAQLLPVMGKVYKELWRTSHHADDLRRAFTYYLEAYTLTGAEYPGINAASLALALGDSVTAHALARGILQSLSHSNVSEEVHWQIATRGEAKVLLGDMEEARLLYQSATKILDRRYGDIASMRKQLQLLRPFRPVDSILDTTLVMPPITVFVGHQPDAEDAANERFPQRTEAMVAMRIGDEITRSHTRIGYSSAAAGADIIFLEVMQSRGFETNIVLPFSNVDFIDTSVRTAGTAWVDRYRRVLQGANRISFVTRESYLGDSGLFEQASLVTEGLAKLRASQLDCQLHFLAVCGVAESQARPGGTRASVDRWQQKGYPVRIINPVPDDRTELNPTESAELAPLDTAPGNRRFVALMFADIAGYSRLNEQTLIEQHQRFLHQVNRRLMLAERAPIHRNTWGDGLFLAFDQLRDAANFALTLHEDLAQLTDTDGSGHPQLARISVHYGPAYLYHDPVINQLAVLGASVIRAARVEPITPPGSVYLTQEAAALLAAEDNSEFHLEYVGLVNLPKNFGVTELFQLRRLHAQVDERLV